MNQTGVVFGVFDGCHPGHTYFLSKAQQLCDELIVVLTLPETSLLLKKRTPKFSYENRAAALCAFNSKIKIIPSDTKPGTWSIFRDPPKRLVILGYDQQGIAVELEKMNIPFVFIDAHHPEKFKSSLLYP